MKMMMRSFNKHFQWKKRWKNKILWLLFEMFCMQNFKESLDELNSMVLRWLVCGCQCCLAASSLVKNVITLACMESVCQNHRHTAKPLDKWAYSPWTECCVVKWNKHIIQKARRKNVRSSVVVAVSAPTTYTSVQKRTCTEYYRICSSFVGVKVIFCLFWILWSELCFWLLWVNRHNGKRRYKIEFSQSDCSTWHQRSGK